VDGASNFFAYPIEIPNVLVCFGAGLMAFYIDASDVFAAAFGFFESISSSSSLSW